MAACVNRSSGWVSSLRVDTRRFTATEASSRNASSDTIFTSGICSRKYWAITGIWLFTRTRMAISRWGMPRSVSSLMVSATCWRVVV